MSTLKEVREFQKRDRAKRRAGRRNINMFGGTEELGAASMRVELSDSTIKVFHGTDRVLLAEGRVKHGTWDALWALLDKAGVKPVRKGV